MIPLDLPEVAADARAHSARLVELARASLARAGGWMSFAQYMDLVLYAPGLGYYSAGTAKFGRGGDFVTAPELSPVFGYCIADAIAGVLDALGGGAIMELGAGTGRLAADVLLELQRRDRLLCEYLILEVSADLRARQAAKLAELPAAVGSRVRWLDRLPETAFDGVILANEVADALPVQRFRRGADGVDELGVTEQADGFAWAPRPADAALSAAVAAIESDLGAPLHDGYESEVSSLTEGWVAGLGATLARGAVFIVDYGLPRAEYYSAARDTGTLSCFFRHRVHGDPFSLVGLQDITAWVDFTRVAEAGIAAGLDVAGYTTQSHFLIDTGFDAALARVLDGLEGLARHAATQAALTLMLPGEMGERFKCIALARGVEVPRGFRSRDFTARL